MVTDHLCFFLLCAPLPPPDNRGLPHRLQNDSGCGTWVREGPGGSVVLEASYSSCYVTEWVRTTQSPGMLRPLAPASRVAPQDSHYVMLVGVEGADAAGHSMVTNTKLLRCPRNPPGKGWKLSGSGWCGAAWNVFLGLFYGLCAATVTLSAPEGGLASSCPVHAALRLSVT